MVYMLTDWPVIGLILHCLIHLQGVNTLTIFIYVIMPIARWPTTFRG